MNSAKIEEELARHGFTGKDLVEMRKRLNQYGITYPALIKALHSQFIVLMGMIVFFMGVWLYIIIFEDKGSIVSYSITMMIVLPLICLFGAIRLSFKSFIYKRKKYS